MTSAKLLMLTDNIRRLTEGLGKPLSSWKAGDAILKIYRGKDLYVAQWPDMIIKNLIFAAREISNLPYGRPLTDKYDAKSAVYIGSATYPLLIGGEYFFLEEWLSVRLVPGNGDPRGMGELEMYTCHGENIEDMVRRSLFGDSEDFLNFVAASNRMCGCRPYFKQGSDEKRITADLLPRKICHTALLYALINKHFVDDFLSHFDSKYITGVIIDRLVDRALTTNIGTECYGTHFTYAHEILKVASSEIKLDRRANNNYVYRYPAYFLNSRQLLEWLEGLVERQVLTKDTIEHYLKTTFSLKDIVQQSHVHLGSLKNLHRLFLAKGKIFGSGISGAELCELADKEVEDGPKLRITPIEDMVKSVDKFLKALDVR